jgi:HD-GYP domain-containing protein (c-di-GMP phosphodiesterase class II)
MLDQGPTYAPVRAIVRASHEHVDGSGYPHGLAGAQIPLGSRIVLAAESYLAMTSSGIYGGMLSAQDGLDRLRLDAGRIYDDAVVTALTAEIAAHAPAA